MTTRFPLNDKLKNNPDIIKLDNLLSGGIENLLEKYKNTSPDENIDLPDIYTLIYLSSEVFKLVDTNQLISTSASDELGTLISILKNNPDFIEHFLKVNNMDILHLQNNFIDNIVRIIFTLELEDKIQVYSNLFHNEIFRQRIIDNHWLHKTAKLSEDNSVLGNIIKSIDLDSNLLDDKCSSIVKFIEDVFIKHCKEDFIYWVENMLIQNYKYLQTASTIEKDETLSSYEFQTQFMIILLSQYKSARLLHCKSVNTIDIGTLNYKDSKINWEKEQRISEFKWKEGDIPDISLFSKLFIYAQKLLELSVLPIIDKIHHSIKNKVRLNDYIKLEKDSIRWGDSSGTMKKIYLNSLEKQRNNYIKTINILSSLLKNRVLNSLVIYFLNDTSKFIINTTLNVEEHSIPSAFIENIGVILEYYKDTIFKKISTSTVEPSLKLIELAVHVVNDRFSYINPYTKVKFVKSLTDNNSIITDILLAYQNNNILFKVYIEGLIKYYIQIDKDGEEAQYYDKNPVRYSINNVLIKLLSVHYNTDNTHNIIQNELSNNLNQIFKLNDTLEQMMYLLISDCTCHMEESITSIERIEIYSDKSVSIQTQINNEEYLQKELSYLFSSMYYLRACFKALKSFCPLIKEQVKDDIIWEKLVQTLNFTISKICNSEKKNIINFDFTQHDIVYSWDSYYHTVAYIYCYFKDESRFINVMANAQFLYNKKYISYLQKTSSDEYTDNLSILIENIKQLHDIAPNIKYKEEFPTEFCDPLLYTPIVNPIILPESNIFMDKKSIISHLLHDETDPFNRTKLTKEDLEKYNNLPENISKIETFLQRIEKWKLDNTTQETDTPETDISDNEECIDDSD